jgi:hypothetical protein
MGKIFVGILCVFFGLTMAGCLNVNATVPEGVINTAPKVDSSRVPHPRTLPEAQDELNRSYAYIQRLERKVQKLEDDKLDLKIQNSDYKKRLKKYEDD